MSDDIFLDSIVNSKYPQVCVKRLTSNYTDKIKISNEIKKDSESNFKIIHTKALENYLINDNQSNLLIDCQSYQQPSSSTVYKDLSINMNRHETLASANIKNEISQDLRSSSKMIKKEMQEKEVMEADEDQLRNTMNSSISMNSMEKENYLLSEGKKPRRKFWKKKKSIKNIGMISYESDYSAAAAFAAATVASSGAFAPVSTEISKSSHLRCSNCEFEAPGLLILRQHIIQNHSAKVFRCTECEYIATSDQSLKNHSLNHFPNSSQSKCEGCDYKTDSEIDLIHHVKSHMYVCSRCVFGTNLKEDFISHLQSHSNEVLKCRHCRYRTRDSLKFELHLTFHIQKNSLKPGRFFKCCKCSYETNYEKLHKKHLLTHLSRAKFHCNQCPYFSQRKHALMRHLRSHLNVKLFKCSECKYETNRKEYLMNHTLKHFTNRKLFQCSQCEYGTNWKHCLTRHQKCHTYCYKCDVCSFETPNTNHLDEHLVLKHGLYEDKETREMKKIFKIIIVKKYNSQKMRKRLLKHLN